MFDKQHAQLRSLGFWCYRDHFRWGFSPAYRNEAGQFRFVDKGDILTPSEMLARLNVDWCPQAASDVSFFMNGMTAEFANMKD